MNSSVQNDHSNFNIILSLASPNLMRVMLIFIRKHPDKRTSKEEINFKSSTNLPPLFYHRNLM